MGTWRFELNDGSIIRGEGNTEAEAYLQAQAALTQKGGVEQVSPPSKGQVEYAPSERVTSPVRGLFRAGAEGLAGGLEAVGQSPWSGPLGPILQAAGSLVPRTPESLAMAVLPGIKGGKAVMSREGATTRGLLSYPAVGGLTAGITGGPQEIIPGMAQGTAAALAGMTARGLDRLGARQAEVSLGSPAAVAREQIIAAQELDRAVVQGTRIPLVGRSASERLIKGSGTIQEAASADYGSMQTAVERGMRRQTLSLPYLGSIRGKEITIPAQPGQPIPGHPSLTGRPTPASSMVDNSFTISEAFKALKDLRQYVAVKTAKEMGLPMSDLHLVPGKVLADASTMAREEFAQALHAAGRSDLATEFQRASQFYYRAERHKEALEALQKGGAYKSAGHGREGGLDADKARQLLYEGKLGDPNDIPEIAASLTKGFPLGVTEVERPGFGHSVGRIYAPRFGIALGTSPRRVPIGTDLTVPPTRFPKVIGGLGALGAGNVMAE